MGQTHNKHSRFLMDYLSFLFLASATQAHTLKENQYELNLAKKLQTNERCCGQVCETRAERLGPPDFSAKRGKYLGYIDKQVYCFQLFECHQEIDKGATSDKPPEHVSSKNKPPLN